MRRSNFPTNENQPLSVAIRDQSTSYIRLADEESKGATGTGAGSNAGTASISTRVSWNVGPPPRSVSRTVVIALMLAPPAPSPVRLVGERETGPGRVVDGERGEE